MWNRCIIKRPEVSWRNGQFRVEKKNQKVKNIKCIHKSIHKYDSGVNGKPHFVSFR